MKKIIHHTSVVILAVLTLSSSAFAGMTIHGDLPPYNPRDPAYTAKIFGADYFYNHGKMMMSISLFSDDPSNRNIQIDFFDGDLAIGMSMVSAIGKSMTVYFANSNFDIEQLHVDQYSDSSTLKSMKRLHSPLIS